QPTTTQVPSISITSDESAISASEPLVSSSATDEHQRKVDAQFAPLTHPDHLYVRQHHGEPLAEPIIDEPAYYYVLTTYISYLLLIAFGHARDFFGKRFGDPANYHALKSHNGYAPLN